MALEELRQGLRDNVRFATGKDGAMDSGRLYMRAAVQNVGVLNVMKWWGLAIRMEVKYVRHAVARVIIDSILLFVFCRGNVNFGLCLRSRCV